MCKVAEGTGKEKEAFVSYDFKLRHKLGGSLRESATKLNSGRSVKLDLHAWCEFGKCVLVCCE